MDQIFTYITFMLMNDHIDTQPHNILISILFLPLAFKVKILNTAAEDTNVFYFIQF